MLLLIVVLVHLVFYEKPFVQSQIVWKVLFLIVQAGRLAVLEEFVLVLLLEKPAKLEFQMLGAN